MMKIFGKKGCDNIDEMRQRKGFLKFYGEVEGEGGGELSMNFHLSFFRQLIKFELFLKLMLNRKTQVPRKQI